MLTEGEQFQAWLQQHVEPRILAIENMAAQAPMSDAYVSGILDKAITPFVYWLREQPLPRASATVHPVAPIAASDAPGQPGRSLSMSPNPAWLDQHGLLKSNHKEASGIELYAPSRFLGPDIKAVSEEFKRMGFFSGESNQGGRKEIWWERRIP